MATFKVNQKGLDDFEAQLQGKLDAAVARGEAQASAQTPEAYAESVGRELSALGVAVNHDALLTQYRDRFKPEAEGSTGH